MGVYALDWSHAIVTGAFLVQNRGHTVCVAYVFEIAVFATALELLMAPCEHATLLGVTGECEQAPQMLRS